ncbi:MAG: hypothetical protein P1P71_06650, partial [Anaerosomatales bacterium]|nr:hypothetical protein [Anaerosomatales bacterium]
MDREARSLRTYVSSRGWGTLKIPIIVLSLAVVMLLATAGMALAEPTVQSDLADYPPGATVTLLGSGWSAADSPVQLLVVAEGNVWSWEGQAFLDEWGAFTAQLTLPDWFVSPYYVTATGATGTLATTTFTDTSTDWKQLQNTDNKWIGSALNDQNSDYTEGMSVPQRLVLEGLDTDISPSYVTLEYQFTKSGKYAYDFITSWDQAITAADAYGGQTWLDEWKWLDYNSADFPYQVSATVPEDPHAPDRTAAYEGPLGYGDRTIDLYASADIWNVEVTIDPTLSGTTTGDSKVSFTVTWEGAADKVMILYGGHIAVGLDPIPVTGIGWGPGMGAGAISGAPYHQYLTDGTNQWTGNRSQDNQLMSQGIRYSAGITGMKWGDANGNGVMDGREVGLEGWDIWVDVNGNGIFDEGIDVMTTTLEDGSYALYFYPPNGAGTFDVYEVGQAEYVQTYPSAPGYHSVSVTPGYQEDGYDFGNMLKTYELALVKTGAWFDSNDNGYPEPGEPINYMFSVTNMGNQTLTNVTVTDDLYGVLVAGGPLAMLAPGATDSTTFTGVYHITQADIDAAHFYNKAWAHSNESGDVWDDEDVPLRGTGPQPASIEIEKATNGEDADDPTGPYIPVGDGVTWAYVVTNTGYVTLSSIEVTDSVLGAIGTIESLAPGESHTLYAYGTAVASQYANIGTATGSPPEAHELDDVTDSDPSHYFGSDPAINIDKVTNDSDGPYIHVG